MEKLLLEALGRIAYNAHTSFSGRPSDAYFRIDITTWAELPESSKAHWRRIAFAVIKAGNELDCGDLV
jgi:hypothetical protein